MKIIDEIIELLEEQAEGDVFVDPSNRAIQDFLKFRPMPQGKKIFSRAAQPIQKPVLQKIKTVSTINTPQKAFEYTTPVTAEINTLSMSELKNVALSCKKCSLSKSRKNVVFGEGNINTELMFIGEAPGRDEDIQGKPFVGKSGYLLTKMIKAMGYDRSEIYISNIIKCRPPFNRNPNPDEAAYCLNYLNRQIDLITPKVLILLGGVALQFLLNLYGITRQHGHWKEYKGIKVMPTFHPAYLLRNPGAKRDAWEDLQKVMKFLGKI